MEQTVVKIYRGRQQAATTEYMEDAEKMAQKGYKPTNQVWTPGLYGFGSFVIALLLCFIVIGFIVFIYMLIVKPAGALTVTYSLMSQNESIKTCPKCAESVKMAAIICHYCGHHFDVIEKIPEILNVSNQTKRKRSGAEDFGRKLGRLFAKK